MELLYCHPPWMMLLNITLTKCTYAFSFGEKVDIRVNDLMSVCALQPEEASYLR